MKTALWLLAVAASAYAEDLLEVRLGREMALPAGIVLRGPNPTQWLSFTLPRDRQVKSARLRLLLRPSNGLLAGSQFAVAVNGTPVHSVRLDTSGNSNAEVLVESAIPVDALQDYNRLELRAELHDSPGHCESPTDPALWVAVSAASSMTFDIGGYRHDPKLEDFPVPLADPLDYRPSRVRFVLTTRHTSADFAVAAHIAGALGDRIGVRHVDLSAAPTFDADADAGQVLFGTPEELAKTTGSVAGPLPLGEGRLRLVESRHAGRYLLLVEGGDATARQNAAIAAIPAGPSNGRLRGLLPQDESFRLADLASLLPQDASGPGITVRGAEPEAIVIPLRPGAGEHFVRGEQTVHLEFAYSPQVEAASSAMEVRLNGKTLGGRPLERSAGSSSETMDLALPADAMGVDNRLEVRFHLYPKVGGACATSGNGGDGAQLWATLLDSSSFHLPRDLYADLPDLSLLRGGGVPFTYGQTIWLVRPQDGTLFLNAAFLLGRLSGAAPADARFESELTPELRRNAHLIVLADGPNLTLHEAISPWNSQRVLLTVSGSGQSAALLQDPLLIARLAGGAITMDDANRVRVTPAGPTTRFGAIRLDRRVKYWVLDNMAWLMLDSIAFLLLGMMSLRYIRRHYFPPIPDVDDTDAGD
jgi:cellulose synthase operon protein B